MPISQKLWRDASEKIRQVASTDALTKLSKRPKPKIEKDANEYRESKLITSFTDLILCIDEDDKPLESDLLKAVESHDSDREEVNFEYHGKIHFGWADCIVVPRDLHDKDETPEQQIARMLECIKIAHVFLGTCEAFEKLFLSEIFNQVGHYVAQAGEVRSSRDLNRLRTLALAVVSLTQFNTVAAADEDQQYFALFEKHARIKQRHKIIQKRCDILYSVQADETRVEEETRQQRLNSVVQLLTALTFISVLSDSYNFIQAAGKEPLIPEIFLIRGEILLSIVLAIVLVIYSLEHGFSVKLQLFKSIRQSYKWLYLQLQGTLRKFSKSSRKTHHYLGKNHEV